MNNFYRIIRIITVAPILALAMVIVVGINCKEVFPTVWHMVYSLFFIGILPLLSYPLQKYIPGYKNKGREGQRNLAIIFAALGFTLGCILSFVFPTSVGLQVIFTEYFLGSAIILFCNKVCQIRISGHACGALAPVVLFIHFNLYTAAFVGAALAVLIFIASIKTKRHTLSQLIGGGLVPLISIMIISLIY